MPARKVGPASIRDPNLRISDLPQKEIAQAHLSAGADEQVGIGKAAGVEMVGDDLFRYCCLRIAAALHLFQYGVEGIRQFGPGAVIQGDVQDHTGVGSRKLESVVEVMSALTRQL